MSGIEKAPHKIGFRRSVLKSYTRQFVAIVGISFALMAGSLQAEFAYVANDGSNNISAYHIAENGALTPVAGSPFIAGSAPRSVAVDLLGRFVYVANFSSSDISAYRIAPNGALTAVSGSPFTGVGYPASVAVRPLH
jgi:6-phosphogluconolactonase (cycloisomerase 2 family)